MVRPPNWVPVPWVKPPPCIQKITGSPAPGTAAAGR